MKLTIKRRIMLLYTLLTTILLGILLPIVYVTVSASLNLDIQSRLNNAIAQVLIAVDDQDEKFVLNDQVDLPDYISMCVMDGNGKLIFSTPGGEWLPQVSTDTTGNTIYRNETYTVLREKFKIEENTVTAFAAISSDYALRSLNILKLLLIILTPIYLVFSVAGAYILARRAIRPIAEITKAASMLRIYPNELPELPQRMRYRNWQTPSTSCWIGCRNPLSGSGNSPQTPPTNCALL